MGDEHGGPDQAVVELQALQRVAADVASSRDLDELLARCIDHTRQMARAPSGAIYLRDEASGAFRRLIARDTVNDEVHLPVAQIDAALSGRGYFVAELDNPAIAWHPGVQAGRARGFRVVLTLGMRWHERVIGVLILAWREAVVIPASTLRTLEALMVYQAAAIENARALRRVERRAELAQALRDFSRRALTTTDEEMLLALTVDTACALTRADAGAVARLDGDALVMSARRGALPERLAADDPQLGRALGPAAPTFVEAPAAARAAGLAALGLVSLRRGDGADHLLVVGTSQPPAWIREEAEALEMLSSIAAEALARAEVQAAEARERRRLDDTLEHLPIGVVVLDGAGRMLHNNRASTELGALLGAIGASYADGLSRLRKPDGSAYEMKDSIVTRALLGEQPAPRDVPVVDADGRQRVIRAVAAPLHQPGQPPAAVLGFSDVSELFELAAAKDQFMRVASHELRSPVTALRATAQLLLLDPGVASDEERRRTLHERIDRQSARLVKLVTQLLDSSRLQADALPLEREDVDLAALAREVAEAAGPRVEVVAAAPVRGRWDAARLEQVLTNLVANALHYSPPDTTVLLRVADEGARVRIRVEDRGVGIAPEELDQLFHPFFRGRRTTGRHKTGLGLGLHITREIVRRHGGTLQVDSLPGAGSVFTVELPR